MISLRFTTYLLSRVVSFTYADASGPPFLPGARELGSSTGNRREDGTAPLPANAGVGASWWERQRSALAKRRLSHQRPPNASNNPSRRPALSTTARSETVLPCAALSICQATNARVRGPIHARPEIDSGTRVPEIALDAVRRIASGPRNRTTASLALPPRPRRDSNSTEPRPSTAWFSRLARNRKTVSRGAAISPVALISRRMPNRVETPEG
jgi:hypothetical protein